MKKENEFFILLALVILSLLVASAWTFEDNPNDEYPAPTTPVAYPKPVIVVPTATNKPKKEKEQPKPTEEKKPTNAPTEAYP